MDGAYLVVGADVLGPASGAVYAYLEGAGAPVRIDPLRGPFGSGGAPWRDLYAASDTPFPESAWQRYQGTPGSGAAAANRELGSVLLQAAVRHTRLFLLFPTGQLAALDSRTLDYSPSWQFPVWPGVTPGIPLHVSETLVYAAPRSPSGVTVRAVEIGQGRPVVELPLPYVSPRVTIAGGELFVIGDAVPGSQPVEIYSLAAGVSPGVAPPPVRSELPLAGRPTAGGPRPVRLGSEWVFAAADGKVYRWNAAPGSTPQVVWPNPIAAAVRQDWIPLGPQELGLVVDARQSGGTVSLIRVGLNGDTARLLGALDLTFAREAQALHLAACNGRLYLPVHTPGSSILVYSLSLQETEPQLQQLCALPGTQEASIDGWHVVPWQGAPMLLLHYGLQLQRQLVLLHPLTGTGEALQHRPVREHRIEILHEANQLWMANCTQGRLQRLD